MYYLPVIVHKLSLVWCGPRAQPLLLIIICKPVPVRSRKLFTAARRLPVTSAVTAGEWNTSVSCLSRHQVAGRSFVTPLCHMSPECLCLMRCRGAEQWSVACFTFAWFYSDWRKSYSRLDHSCFNSEIPLFHFADNRQTALKNHGRNQWRRSYYELETTAGAKEVSVDHFLKTGRHFHIKWVTVNITNDFYRWTTLFCFTLDWLLQVFSYKWCIAASQGPVTRS